MSTQRIQLGRSELDFGTVLCPFDSQNENNFCSIHRASELEIENERLHKDILLLRNSIDRGIAEKELEGKKRDWFLNSPSKTL